MIDTKDICFVTTSLYTKWIKYQSKIIKNLFPESQHLIIDGRTNWPNSWFYWINEIKKTSAKFFVHIDEDFFISDRTEFLRVFSLLDNFDIVGCPDGYHPYRGANPVAMNTFLLFGRTEILNALNFDTIRFAWDSNLGWLNNFGLIFKDSYKIDWNYQFSPEGAANFQFQQEPYYAFFWMLKENHCKFKYLYPKFDERFKSTNPRIEPQSSDIGIHMWYTRNWYTQELVHGMANIERYNRVESYLISELLSLKASE